MPTSATPNAECTTILRTIAMQIIAQQLSEHAKTDPTVYVKGRAWSLEVTSTVGDTSVATLWRDGDSGWESVAGVVITSEMQVGAPC